MRENVVELRAAGTRPAAPKGIVARLAARLIPRPSEEPEFAASYLRDVACEAESLRSRVTLTEDPFTGEFRLPVSLAREVLAHLAVQASEARLIARKVEITG